MMSGNIYTYDSENHMLSMSNSNTSVTMKYDAFGNRVSKTVNGVTTQYLVEDDVNPTGYPQVVDETVNGAVTRQYTYGLQRISGNLSPVITGNSTWTPSFYGYDGFGSVRQLTNSAGVVTDEYEYDAFGNSFTRQGTTPNNYLYRGEQYDSDLGLYYLRARYYNPNTGRFLSRDPYEGDPSDPVTLHKYLYVGGDPVNWIDPPGWELEDDAEIEEGESVASEEELEEVGERVDCVLQTVEDIFSVVEAIEEADAVGTGLSLADLYVDAQACYAGGHSKGKSPSKRGKHEGGQGRGRGARSPSTHPKSVPRKRPPNWPGGPWPPPPGTPWW
jgi:RHS repeat-associated protein